jgi:Pyridoxal-phosphate dependent enzyme
MKDRVAKAMVEAAASDGRLKPGGTVVEYTAGTTGISLALVCAAKGYNLKIVFSDAFSDEKRYTMQAFGAKIRARDEFEPARDEFEPSMLCPNPGDRTGISYVGRVPMSTICLQDSKPIFLMSALNPGSSRMLS